MSHLRWQSTILYIPASKISDVTLFISRSLLYLPNCLLNFSIWYLHWKHTLHEMQSVITSKHLLWCCLHLESCTRVCVWLFLIILTTVFSNTIILYRHILLLYNRSRAWSWCEFLTWIWINVLQYISSWLTFVYRVYCKNVIICLMNNSFIYIFKTSHFNLKTEHILYHHSVIEQS